MELVINAGSSSLKFTLFKEDKLLLSGKFDRLGKDTVFEYSNQKANVSIENHKEATNYLITFLEHNNLLQTPITQTVHRVVHGGEKYKKATVITEEVVCNIKKLSTLAPLHNPANLAGIQAAKTCFPHAKHVAVFDTAFHQTIAKEIFLYGLPMELYKKFKIRKYGFHGISHQYISLQVTKHYQEKVDSISCHLGSGSSITALKQGISVDTTMGFTPLDGVLMGTRSGEIDPDIPLFLIKEGHYTVDEVEEILSKKSGLQGVSGKSDLRDIWQGAKTQDPEDQLALDMLCYKIAYFINAMKTTVPNPKAIIFTGGIGEQAWYVRKKVCDFLQIELNDIANKQNAQNISLPHAPIDVLVLHTDEQRMMHELAKNL